MNLSPMFSWLKDIEPVTLSQISFFFRVLFMCFTSKVSHSYIYLLYETNSIYYLY